MKREVRTLIIIATVLVVLSVGFHLIFGSSDKKEPVTQKTGSTLSVKEDSTIINKKLGIMLYGKSYDKLFTLNVGQAFNKDSSITLEVDNYHYTVDVYIREARPDYCEYGIRACTDDPVYINWNYSIKTQNNKIISILKLK